jgi:hypothetical protein
MINQSGFTNTFLTKGSSLMPNDQQDDPLHRLFDSLKDIHDRACTNALVKGVFIEAAVEAGIAAILRKSPKQGKELVKLTEELEQMAPAARDALKVAFDAFVNGKSWGQACTDLGIAKHHLRGVAASPLAKSYLGTWIVDAHNRQHG